MIAAVLAALAAPGTGSIRPAAAAVLPAGFSDSLVAADPGLPPWPSPPTGGCCWPPRRERSWPCVNRLSRWVLSDATVASGEVVLLDRIHSTPATTTGAIPSSVRTGTSTWPWATGGVRLRAHLELRRANDAARDRHVLPGKILRITREPGVVPADNLFLAAGSGPCHSDGTPGRGTAPAARRRTAARRPPG